jgi:hypothetical protein
LSICPFCIATVFHVFDFSEVPLGTDDSDFLSLAITEFDKKTTLRVMGWKQDSVDFSIADPNSSDMADEASGVGSSFIVLELLEKLNDKRFRTAFITGDNPVRVAGVAMLERLVHVIIALNIFSQTFPGFCSYPKEVEKRLKTELG